MQIPLVIMSSTVFYLLFSLLSLVQLAKGSLSLSVSLSVIFCDNLAICDMCLHLFLYFEIQPNSIRILCSSCCAMAILISTHSTVISCYGKHVRESILAFSSSPGELSKDRKCSSWWSEWNFDSPVKVSYIALIKIFIACWITSSLKRDCAWTSVKILSNKYKTKHCQI